MTTDRPRRNYRRAPEPYGKRFGRLVVLPKTEQELGSIRERRFVACRCDCGVACSVRRSVLLGGQATSCGACIDRGALPDVRVEGDEPGQDGRYTNPYWEALPANVRYVVKRIHKDLAELPMVAMELEVDAGAIEALLREGERAVCRMMGRELQDRSRRHPVGRPKHVEYALVFELVRDNPDLSYAMIAEKYKVVTGVEIHRNTLVSIVNRKGAEAGISQRGSKRKPRPPGMLTTGEVAKVCRVAENTVYRWFENGLVTGIRAARGRSYHRESLASFLRETRRFEELERLDRMYPPSTPAQ